MTAQETRDRAGKGGWGQAWGRDPPAKPSAPLAPGAAGGEMAKWARGQLWDREWPWNGDQLCDGDWPWDGDPNFPGWRNMFFPGLFLRLFLAECPSLAARSPLGSLWLWLFCREGSEVPGRALAWAGGRQGANYGMLYFLSCQLGKVLPAARLCLCFFGVPRDTLTHTHMHSGTLTHSHTLGHTLTYSGTLSHTLTYFHTHSRTLGHTHTHSHTLSHTLTHTRAHSHTLTHTHTHSHALGRTLTHSCILSHTHALSHTCTRGVVLERWTAPGSPGWLQGNPAPSAGAFQSARVSPWLWGGGDAGTLRGVGDSPGWALGTGRREGRGWCEESETGGVDDRESPGGQLGSALLLGGAGDSAGHRPGGGLEEGRRGPGLDLASWGRWDG